MRPVTSWAFAGQSPLPDRGLPPSPQSVKESRKSEKLLRFRTGLLAGCFPVVKENRTTAFVSGGF
jgi:hypothetical protein